MLTAVPDPESEIDGLIAAVPGSDWATLDAREKEYDRLEATHQIGHGAGELASIAIYSVPEARRAPPHPEKPILLSYLDVVLQGYLDMFGEAGARKFFDTTENWHAPIRNDRHDPVYPRAQRLASEEIAWIDAELATRGLQPRGA